MVDIVRVTGLAELQRYLDQVPAKVERNVLRGGLRAGMKEVLPAARAGIRSQSGLLAQGLRIGTRARGGRVVSYLKASGKHAHVAPWVEFGTRAHRIPKLGAVGVILSFAGRFFKSIDHPGARPRPFLRPALDSRAGAAVLAAANYMKNKLSTKHGLDTSDVRIEGDE